ncbi:heme acquisition protein HasA [Yersinia ruckeri]|uniref:Hemophore HasA n=1 Tax=Yersinia ruckeri TaxID=29486 RepID=A0A085U3K2_YERRU|nr:heme acquisition protein HasA [Yersinia ruckeri]AKA38623.1 heme acquisition hemophore HasA [Yersinia ruckeri]ARZ02716.1 hemophore HasA [Yersinia ruckeri]AUQ41434.1 heme acquisition hemophore HasA [Yersinia ruckeri]EKN3347417.1 heme acquisition hemophore HasA [Yersinia ruckeri]EKN3362818.1 heme acquisition hemophore HasA [Yersinia ruckeri]
MNVTIKYQNEFSDYTISSYMNKWATTFGNIDQAAVKDRGQFFGGDDQYNGTQYSISSSHGSSSAMIIDGTLHYSYFPKHTFYGQMDSIQFGESLHQDQSGSWYLTPAEVSFSGLHITGSYDDELTMEQNHQGNMHKITHGLMRGNPDPMLEILKAKGIDVDTAFKDLSIATQYDSSDVMGDMPIVETIGVADNSEMLLVA